MFTTDRLFTENALQAQGVERSKRQTQIFCFATANTIHINLFWEHNGGYTEPDQNFTGLYILSLSGNGNRYLERS